MDGTNEPKRGSSLRDSISVDKTMNAPILILGEVVSTLSIFFPDNHFDACLCDPPYLLEFMGKDFDKQHKLKAGANDGQRMYAWHVDWCREVYRVLKPGGFILAFGGTRTVHRLTCALEDAGFEIRDTLAWLYGSGFPKSHDVSKGIDRLNGDEREVIGQKWKDRYPNGPGGNSFSVSKGVDGTRTADNTLETAPGSDQSALWSGYGTALKPAHEPIILAMKPLDSTFAKNALTYGVAGLNIDGTRIEGIDPANAKRLGKDYTTGDTNFSGAVGQVKAAIVGGSLNGRWPANLILSHHPSCTDTDCHSLCAVRLLDEQSGPLQNRANKQSSKNIAPIGYGAGKEADRDCGDKFNYDNSSGGASRFFYCAKVSTRERNLGDIDCRHPTLKPIDLCRYLATLLLPPVTPANPSPRLLVPFSGAGSEVAGAMIAGWSEVYGIERDEEHMRSSICRTGAVSRGEYKSSKPSVVAQEVNAEISEEHQAMNAPTYKPRLKDAVIHSSIAALPDDPKADDALFPFNKPKIGIIVRTGLLDKEPTADLCIEKPRIESTSTGEYIPLDRIDGALRMALYELSEACRVKGEQLIAESKRLADLAISEKVLDDDYTTAHTRPSRHDTASQVLPAVPYVPMSAPFVFNKDLLGGSDVAENIAASIPDGERKGAAGVRIAGKSTLVDVDGLNAILQAARKGQGKV